MPVPVYSHGGPSMGGFPTVTGNTTNSGNPVQILNTIEEPVMNIFFTGTSCTVLIEGNGGVLDPISGNPPSGEWIDYSSGGYALTNGQTLSKVLPKTIPYWRTRITAIVAGTLVSYVPALIVFGGNVASAGRPVRQATAYNPNV